MVGGDAGLRILKDGELMGIERQEGDLVRSRISLGKDGRLTFSSESKGETWSVVFSPDEVEMITREVEGINDMTTRELAGKIRQHLDELKRNPP